MKRYTVILLLGFIVSLVDALASPESEATKRAKEFADLFASQREEPAWMDSIIPEYWHPLGNDSGMPSRNPDFLPKIDTPRGNFLFTKSEVGRVLSGKSPWILGGKETVWCVEILFTTVARIENQIEILKSPQIISQFFVMALDKKDNKWKNLDSYPDRTNFYEIPYFLKSWEKILGKGSVKNIPEVRQRLLDFVKK